MLTKVGYYYKSTKRKGMRNNNKKKDKEKRVSCKSKSGLNENKYELE